MVIYWIGKKLTSKKIIGWGDVKLITVLALFLGWEIIFVIYIGVVLGGLVAIVRVATKNLGKGSKIPLSPFIFLGSIFDTIYPLQRIFDQLLLL